VLHGGAGTAYRFTSVFIAHEPCYYFVGARDAIELEELGNVITQSVMTSLHFLCILSLISISKLSW
jgi:hypothetical protein